MTLNVNNHAMVRFTGTIEIHRDWTIVVTPKAKVIEISTQTEEKPEKAEEKHKTLLEAVKGALDEHVKEVRLSSRLTKSAACLVGDEEDMSPTMERLLDQVGQAAPKQKRILEINPDHPLLAKMNALHIADDTAVLTDFAQLVYGQALLAEGSPLPDTVEFNRLLSDVMIRAASAQ